MAFTMFREEAKEDGTPGPVSMRRVLAFLLVLASIGVFIGGFLFAENGWFVFLPGIVCLSGSLLLLFFTTWADLSSTVRAFRKTEKM